MCLCVCSSRPYHLLTGAGPPPLLKWYLPCSFSKGHTLTVFCISSHFLLPAPPPDPCFYLPFWFTGRGRWCNESVVQSRVPLGSAATSAARVVEGGAALSSCLSASSWLLYWSSGLPLGGVYQATPPLSPSWAQMQLSRQQGGSLLVTLTVFAERQWARGLRIQNCVCFLPAVLHLERGGVSLDGLFC